MARTLQWPTRARCVDFVLASLSHFALPSLQDELTFDAMSVDLQQLAFFVVCSIVRCVSQELVEGELPHGVPLTTQAEVSETEGVVAMTFAVSYFLD